MKTLIAPTLRHSWTPEGYSDNLTGKLCGDFLEVLLTPEQQHAGQQPGSGAGGTAVPETPESLLKRSIARSQKSVRQLCNANRLYVLHTLTFALRHPSYFKGEKPFSIAPVEEQKDRDFVLCKWREFARKMRVYSEKRDFFFRYIAIIEKHTGKRRTSSESDKEGTYHVHFLSDRVFGKRLLQGKWGYGLCNYADWAIGTKKKETSDKYTGAPPDNPGAYASKYLGKDMDGEYLGRKRYWASRNLQKPIALHGDELRRYIGEGRLIYNSVSEIKLENATLRTLRSTYVKRCDSAEWGGAGEQSVRAVLKKKKLKDALLRYYNNEHKEKSYEHANRKAKRNYLEALQRPFERKRLLGSKADSFIGHISME